MKLIRAVLYPVCAILIAAAVLCVISDLNGGVPEVVYALDAEKTETKLQAGLMSVLGSVNSMRTFYQDVQTINTESPGERILVGTNHVNCAAMDRTIFSTCCTSSVQALGYTAMQQIAENRMSYEDYDALLRIVEAEATGGDVLSKLAIANVVLNRTKDSHFPDTISGVVWQRLDGQAQFSPVSDGRIYSVVITKTTIEAVDRALSGEDNSQGALFFVARSSASKANLKWFDEALVKLFEYGGHEFCTFKGYVEEE